MRGGRQTQDLRWILLEDRDAWRKQNPGMTTAVVDRIQRRGKGRIAERADRHGYPPVLVPLFGVEHGRSPDWAEAKSELGTLITCSDKLGRHARYFVRRNETGKCREHATGTSLARQAMTDTYALRLTLNLDR